MSKLQAYFTDETAAVAKLESILWPNGPVCPKCGVIGEAYELKGKRARPGLRRCSACRKDFTVKVGTVFEDSHIPVHKWFQAAYLMCSSKKGVSAHQLHRTLEITYKSAWFLAHRLREAMVDGTLRGLAPMGGAGKIVEADETYVGGKEKNKHKRVRTSQVGGAGKQVVFTLVERGGGARSHHVADVSGKTLRAVLRSQVDAKSAVMTDDAGQYRHVGDDFARHEAVNHGIEEYVRGDAHTNTAEGYFSVLKRGIIGTYHHVSPQHLKRYLAEFDFRYSNRAALGVDDTERTIRALCGIVGKRLTYRDSSAA
jgi:transposase-like protein